MKKFDDMGYCNGCGWRVALEGHDPNVIGEAWCKPRLCEFEWPTDIGVHDCERRPGHVLQHKCRCGRTHNRSGS